MTTRIAFVGDTLLGGDAQGILDRRGYDYPFQGIAPALESADLVVANLEGPLTSLQTRADKIDTGHKRYWYRGLPASASALAAAGVKVVSLANNHVLDFGVDGLGETIAALESAGIAHCGAGLDEAQARRPVVVTVNRCRIGFLSLMQRYDIYVEEQLYASGHRGGPRRFRFGQATEDLADLAEQADLRIPLVHWGRNYRGVTSRQRRLARALIQSGADVVIGHHPHIPQRIDLGGGTPVFYSLGNGPIGTPGRFHSGRPPFGLIATIEIDDDARLARIDLRLALVDNSKVGYRPVLIDDIPARRFLWSLVSPFERWRITADGRLSLNLAGRRSSRPPVASRPVELANRSW